MNRTALQVSIRAATTAGLAGAMVCGDGQSNWYKGVQLITVYAMIGLMFYRMPELPG